MPAERGSRSLDIEEERRKIEQYRASIQSTRFSSRARLVQHTGNNSSKEKMGKLMQLRLLLWKNFLLQIRRPVSTCIEFLLPITACIIMIAFRQIIKPETRCFRTCQDVDLRYKASRINVDNSSAPVLGYYPDTPLARSIMETASCMSSGSYISYSSDNVTAFVGQPFQLRAYNSTAILEQEASANAATTDVLGAIVFEGLTDRSLPRLPLDVRYAIRLRPSTSGSQRRGGPSWRTSRQTPRRFEQSGIYHYVSYGPTFVPLQYMINQAITRVQSEGGGQCLANSTGCPDVSAVVTTCNMTAVSSETITIEFDASSPESITTNQSDFECTCNRSTLWHASMEIYTTNCSCNKPLGNQTCSTDGPVGVSCCGRCGSTGNSTKTFLPAVIKNFPYPSYLDDTFLLIAGFMLGLLLVLSLIYPAGMFVREIVVEKNTRLRETMKMMGLDSSLNFLSWFLKQFVFWATACVFITIIINAGNVYPKSDGFLMFLFFLNYCVSAILFLLMLSSLFSTPRVAMICAFVLFYMTYVPYISLSSRYDDISLGAKIALCFFNVNSALGMGLIQYSRRETSTEGVQFSNAAMGLSVEDDFSMAHVFGMLNLNSLLYIIILWYVENVFPGEFGVPKPFYFFLKKSYWLGDPDEAEIEDLEENNITVGNAGDHEEEPAGATVGISIRKLRKVYHTGGKSKLAVDNLSLNMYSGQITSLLGHNGAGKTTTMSMLVGLFPPTSGDAFISGHSVRTDIEKIRTSLGLCPQHNVLYDLLTVHEHLAFFLELKTGRRGKEAEEEIQAMIKDLQLEDKTDWKAEALSGGMKRKLSVAIALIGGSKVVILDEPSSGMDPYARRATWDLLLKHKEGRTILLTTHFMDEADLLGDRIAIMANGRVACSGSSLFLKTRFGVGYHLVIVKDSEQTSEQKALLMKTAGRVTGSRCVGDVGAEVSFVLPQEGVPQFQDFFKDLEVKKEAYGIASFGISVTTLEEVFHRVGESADGTLDPKLKTQYSSNGQYSAMHEDHDARDSPRNIQPMEDGDATSNLLQGASLWCQQFRGMFVKRVLTTLRHPLAITLQLLLPVVLTICALLILKLIGTTYTDPDLLINMSNLKASQAYVADFREGLAREERSYLNENSPGRSYLRSPSLITPVDVFADSLRMRNGSTDCCGPNFILSDTCIRQRYQVLGNNLGVFANCGESFGYKNCPSCLDAHNSTVTGQGNPMRAALLFSGGCGNSRQCPAVPTTTSARRSTTLFQARVLQGSDTGDYFKTWRSGYTLHSHADDLPDSFRNASGADTSANCYQLVRVSCNKPDPADQQPGDPKDCFAYQANDACLPAYDPDGFGYYARIWYSAKGIHTMPYAVDVWSNMHLRNTMNDSSYTITTTNSPLPKTIDDQAKATSNNGISISFGTIATLAMSFLTASFAFNPVEEKQSKSKHVQFVSGVHISVYWMANFAWDLINFSIPLIILLVVYGAFDLRAFKGSAYGAVFVLLIMFGWSGIPLSYLFSFPFSNPLVAYGGITFFQFFLGLVYLVVVFALNVASGVAADTITICRLIFFTLPHYCLAQGLTDIYSNYEIQEICNNLPPQSEIGRGSGRGVISREACYDRQNVRSNPLDWNERGVGKEILYMALSGVFFFIMTIVVEKFLHTSFTEQQQRPTNLQSTDNEDDDVAAERQRIESVEFPRGSDDLVILKNLTKNYFRSKLAVPSADNLCLGIPAGECFGLLGVNGAGKTTTFKMLTGDILPSYGTAFLSGLNVRTELRQVQQRIGYCPQFDALCEKLNAYELLTMYARLRGIPERRIAGIVDQAVQQLNLSKWADRQCGTYSGGNKRKLGAAVALVGDPPVVFLDEPTSGMDPGARRFLWDVLTNVMRAGRTIILTSHSMEECEALCTRLAIMVNGQFKCLGSIQHLKSKFGSGYTIMLKLGMSATGNTNDLAVNTERIESFIEQKFPGACLQESRHGQLQYEIPGERLNLSFIFGELQENKETLNIVDFSVSQTSLEQVFLNFARTASQAQTSSDQRPASPNRNQHDTDVTTSTRLTTPQPGAASSAGVVNSNDRAEFV